jgi:hypothetical protein
MFYVGSDPEFVFYKNGVIPAYKILHRRNALHTDIGLDGEIGTAEIRPQYSSSIYEHINTITKIKAEIQNLCNMYEVNAIAKPLVETKSLGGHIHVSTNTNKNVTAEMVENGIKLQFLLLPAAHFIYGRELYRRYKRSNFHYGSPYDIRSDWGKNHIELRMLPTFLGLNDKNIFSIFNFVVEGMTYLQNNDLKIPIIKKYDSQSPYVAMNFVTSEKEFLEAVNYMYKFIYDKKLGFAIKLLKNINKRNSFIVAKNARVKTLDKDYLGIVLYLSQLKPRKDIVLKRGNKFKVSKGLSKTTVYIDERISDEEFFAKSKKWANKIAKVV